MEDPRRRVTSCHLPWRPRCCSPLHKITYLTLFCIVLYSSCSKSWNMPKTHVRQPLYMLLQTQPNGLSGPLLLFFRPESEQLIDRNRDAESNIKNDNVSAFFVPARSGLLLHASSLYADMQHAMHLVCEQTLCAHTYLLTGRPGQCFQLPSPHLHHDHPLHLFFL